MGYMRGCICRGSIWEVPRLMGLDPSREGEESRRQMSDTTKCEIVRVRSTRGAYGSPVDRQDHTSPQVRSSMPAHMTQNRCFAFARSIDCLSNPLRGHRNRELSG